MNQHLKEIISKDNQEQKTNYFQDQLEATYARIERLEQRETNMMHSLQTTMKEHGTLMKHEKNGNLKPELVDNAISKFNFSIKQDFKKY